MDKGYFPYGNKSIEFLLKRTLFLCDYLNKRGVVRIILACNTLSLITLPFIKLFYKNVTGVFDYFIPFITDKSAIMGSNNTIKILKEIYPNNNLIDGSILIEHIENNKNYNILIKELNNNIKYNSNLILACTHFIELNEDDFIIPIIKNS
ncbi:MAG: hypothetical protein IJY14_00025 [Acholeplasmatales bacterium]|nr:hypothetical protein [Acholeplasmatales bacterium]